MTSVVIFAIILNMYELPDYSKISEEQLEKARAYSPLVTSWFLSRGKPEDIDLVAEFQDKGGAEALHSENPDPQIVVIKDAIQNRLLNTVEESRIQTIKELGLQPRQIRLGSGKH